MRRILAIAIVGLVAGLLWVRQPLHAASPDAQAGVANVPPTTLPASQPTAVSAAEVEFRAKQAFNQGDYAIALPLLRKVEAAMVDRPDQLGQVQEMIRVASKNIAFANAVTTATTGPAGEASGQADRTKHTPPKAGQVLDLSIKELGNFDFDNDKGGNIPPDVQQLTGSTLRVSGFMLPIDQAERITRFALVPSLMNCCFGQPPGIQHTIVVTCPAGKAVSYFPDEITVEGVLKVRETKEDGIILSIFEMTTSSVRPAVK